MPDVDKELLRILKVLSEVNLELKRIELGYQFPFETFEQEPNVDMDRGTGIFYVGFDSVEELPEKIGTRPVNHELHNVLLEVKPYEPITIDLSERVISYLYDPKDRELQKKLKVYSDQIGYKLERL